MWPGLLKIGSDVVFVAVTRLILGEKTEGSGFIEEIRKEVTGEQYVSTLPRLTCGDEVADSHVLALQQISDGGGELIASSEGIEAIEQIVWAGAGFFGTCEVSDDLSLMHHDDSVTEADGLLHGVGDHDGGESIAGDDFVCEADNLVCGGGIECGGVFIEEQEIGFDPCGHEERDGLSLSAGEGSDGVIESIFEPHFQGLEAIGDLVSELS
jgi:hypothetical protein